MIDEPEDQKKLENLLDAIKEMEFPDLESKVTTIIMECQERKARFRLDLWPLEILSIHGSILLTMKHPDVQDDEIQMQILQGIAEKIEEKYKILGFTDEEIKEMRQDYYGARTDREGDDLE